MRSKLGGHFAGTGMYSPAEDDKPIAAPLKPVRLPSDYLSNDQIAKLSGPVITYNLYGGHPNVRSN